MIKRININNLGLFKAFNWDSIRDKGGNVVDLRKENIIYGRNYSGKTTLSRIIRALETKEISPRYINPEFEIVLTNNTAINQSNFDTNTLNVRCFNEDFIKENLSFIINPDSEIKPFAILGENSEIESQIEAIINELGEDKEDSKTLKYKELENLTELVKSKHTEFTSLQSTLDSQLTSKATGDVNSIKQQHAKFGDISYNITKLRNDISEVLKQSFVSIDASKETLNLKQILEVQKANVTHTINFTNVYDRELSGITTLLNQGLLDGNKIAELLANSGLNEWVKKGYEIHTDDRSCDCKFCGNPMSQARWEQLDNHFDEESKKLESALMVYKERIESEIANIVNYKLAGKDSFYLNFNNELDTCTASFDTCILKYKSDLEFLLSKISERLSLLHTPISYAYTPSFSENELNGVILVYEDIKTRNNAYSNEQLNNEEEGARKVNEYLQNYFGHQNLELQAVEEEIESDKKIRFNIIRNGAIAYHLSEGECSIISFCYFMAKLDDIHTAGQKPIILIDDPISSLDSNHIFYIYSLINSELFLKDRFEQIFISTHNLDFLKYLKRLKLTKNQHEFFIINRYQEFSTITIMPKYLKDYVTEFNFLFEQIYNCANADVITDENHHLYYNFGNNARKFLEALLFYKYPSRIDNQTTNANSKRLLKYFGGDQQATALTDRVNNELSHLEEIFDRGMNPIEIPELKRVAQFILDKIEEKDEEQYNALLESIGVEIGVGENNV